MSLLTTYLSAEFYPLYRFLVLVLCSTTLFLNGVIPLLAGFDGYSWSHDLAFCLIGGVLVVGASLANQYQHYGAFSLFSGVSLLISSGF